MTPVLARTGFVLSIDDETFWVRMKDPHAPDEPEEAAEFLLTKLTPEDRAILCVGRLFDLYVNDTEVYFKFITWTVEKSGLEDARREALKKWGPLLDGNRGMPVG